MDRFEEEEMKKIRPNKNTWYDSLINYIPEPIRKRVIIRDIWNLFGNRRRKRRKKKK